MPYTARLTHKKYLGSLQVSYPCRLGLQKQMLGGIKNAYTNQQWVLLGDELKETLDRLLHSSDSYADIEAASAAYDSWKTLTGLSKPLEAAQRHELANLLRLL